MPRLLEPLWLPLISLRENQLAQTVEFLREENRNLRGKLPKRIPLTDREKNRLIRCGLKLGPAIARVITIVPPRSILPQPIFHLKRKSKKENSMRETGCKNSP